jgi:hypothetical protein
MQCLPTLTSISPGSITGIGLTFVVSTVGQLTNYTVTFTPQHSISSTGGFNVTFQSDISLLQFTTCNSTSSVQCAVNATNNTITVNSSTIMPAATAFSITFNNLQNPSYPFQNIAITINTFDNQSSMSSTQIDSGSGTPATSYTPSTLSLPIIASVAPCTGQTLENCTYTISYSNNVQLQSSTVIQLVLPVQLAVVGSIPTFSCGVQTANALSTISPITFTLTSACSANSALTLTITVTNPS